MSLTKLDPAGLGSSTDVRFPNPSIVYFFHQIAGGLYISSYTYSLFGELLTVSMTRDCFKGHTAQQVTQTRTFTYVDGRLASTTFPETPGSKTYGYNGDQLLWKKNYKGVWRKFFYIAAKQLQRVEKYPDSSAVNEDKNRRVTYHYDGHPLSDFVTESVQGRLGAMEYNCGSMGLNCTREFYSYTPGGRLKKKRLEAVFVGRTLEVGFQHDAEGKLQYMAYPSGKVVRYTYNDFARHTGLRDVQPGGAETEVVNNLTYGAAGELKSMSWQESGSQWAGQNWAYNDRLQMTEYSYSGPRGAVSHTYQYSATDNAGRLWRRKDNISGQEVEYTYAALLRLATASVLAGTGPVGQEWGQTYIYDGFGNMKQKIGHGLAANTGFNIAMNSATNNGGAAGGDMDDRTLIYNGEGYQYAPDNKRIAKQFQAQDGQHNHLYLWVGSMRVGTYDSKLVNGAYTHTVVKEDLYVAGRRVAPSDRLGSDLTGGIKLLPYGEELTPPNIPNDRTKFATYHRDATGLDYVDQRYYSPGSGRFMTSDVYLPSSNSKISTSWNRYGSTLADPVNINDPSGLAPCGLVEVSGEPPILVPCPSEPLPLPRNDYPTGPFPDEPIDGVCLISPEYVPSWCPNYDYAAQTPKKPIAISSIGAGCNSSVIASMKTAWSRSSNGATGVEAGFRLDGKPERYSIVDVPSSNDRNATRIPVPADTFAIFHTHPNGRDPHPSPQDRRVADERGLLKFAISAHGLHVYDPKTKLTTLLRQGLDWLHPCQ